MEFIFCLICIVLLLKVNTGTFRYDGITAMVEPQYIENTQSLIEFTCIVPTKGYGPDYTLLWRYGNNACLKDCFFDTTLCENISYVYGQCFCNAHPDPMEDLCPNGTTTVSFTLTDITDSDIDNIIGDWQCLYAMEDLQYTVTLHRFVQSLDPQLDGNFTVKEGDIATFTCRSENGEPSATFQWFIEDEDLTDEAVDGEGQSQLNYTADRNHDNHDIVCKVHQLDKPEREVRKTLVILWAPMVKIGPCAPTHNAEKNNPVELSCEVTNKGKPEVTDTFRWEINGTVIKDKTKQNMTVSDNIQLSDEGSYSCTGVNGVESHSDASELWIIVNYHPEIVEILEGSNIKIIEGNTLYLTCQTYAAPKDISYSWTYNGTEIPGEDQDTFNISNIEPEAVGDYRCQAENSFQICGDNTPKTGGKESQATSVTVLFKPRGIPVASPIDSVIAVETNHTLVCDISGLTAVPEPGWIVWKHDGDVKKNITIKEGGTSWTNQSSDVCDSGNYICEVGNIIGVGETNSNAVSVTIEAPATLEKVSNNKDHPVYNQTRSDDFTLTCLVSATNLDYVHFKHNDTEIAKNEYFGISTNDTASCESGCKYGLSTAYELKVKWKAADLNFTSCHDVVYYDGQYECEATAITAGKPKKEISSKINITTHYSAIWANPDSRLIFAENGEINVSLTCDVCAMPSPSFTWYFNSTDENSKISNATQETYTIANVNRSDFGRYFCKAENEIGAPFFHIDLEESGRADNPQSFYIKDNVTSTSMTVAWTEGHSGNNPPVIYMLDISPTESENCSESKFERYTEVKGAENDTLGTPHQVLIEELTESTKYCIRIKGENQYSGMNATDYICQCGNQTKASPVITEIKIASVESDKLTIRWEYDGTQQYDTYEVGLTFKYQAENDASSTPYPTEGTVDANAKIVVITGIFETDQAYYANATVYEGNNTVPSDKMVVVPIQPGESGATALIVVGTLLILALLVLVILGAVLYRFKPEWMPDRFSRLKGYKEGNRPPGEYDTIVGTGQNEDEGNEIEGNENLAYSTVGDIEDTKPDKECKVPPGEPTTVYADIDMIQTKLHEEVPREVKQPDTTPEDLTGTYAEFDFPEPKDREPPKKEDVKVPEQFRGKPIVAVKPKTRKNKTGQQADGGFPVITPLSTRKQAFDAGNTLKIAVKITGSLDELKVVHDDADLTSHVSVTQTSDWHTATLSIANCKRADSGKYVFSATNECGTMEENMFTIVIARPTMELPDLDDNEEEIYGTLPHHFG